MYAVDMYPPGIAVTKEALARKEDTSTYIAVCGEKRGGESRGTRGRDRQLCIQTERETNKQTVVNTNRQIETQADTDTVCQEE